MVSKDVFRATKGNKKVIVVQGVQNLRNGSRYRVLTSCGSFQSTNTRDFKSKPDAVKYAKRFMKTSKC